MNIARGDNRRAARGATLQLVLRRHGGSVSADLDSIRFSGQAIGAPRCRAYPFERMHRT